MGHRRLTNQEIEDLRVEMKEAGAWMKAELQRRKEAKKGLQKQETGNPEESSLDSRD